MTAKNDNPNITIGDATPIMNVLSDDMSCDESANDARAKSGWLALMSYTGKAYGAPDPEPVEQGIRDLLGDLQHTCHCLGLDFDELVERATNTFQEELEFPLG